MTALIWLALAWLAGDRWFRLLAGDTAELLGWRDVSPWPAILFRLAASLWIGLLPLAWLTYLAAWLADAVLPAAIHPLLPVNVLIMTCLAVWLAWAPITGVLSRRRQARAAAVSRPVWARAAKSPSGSWASLARSLQDRSSRVWLLPLLLWLLLGLLMMFGTFMRDGTLYRAGYSVFSDFAPHTALVSSFSEGRNWPTQYPHYAGDGIAYHFMFFFLCGNLRYLGLPLDLAVNLPSLLGLICFAVLLGLLAVRLTGRRATFLLAPLLLYCRSSLAFFTYLGDLAGQFGTGPASWPQILAAMLRQDTFIGDTTHDSWGLWGVNVYANQRHLLPGLSVALVILFLFLPAMKSESAGRLLLRATLFGRSAWLPPAGAWRRYGLAIALGAMLPYFHGSVLVALLLILAVMAVFSAGRLAHAAFAAFALAAALLQSAVFAGDASAIQPQFWFGFIAPDRSPAGVLVYLLEMSGLALPLAAVAFCLPGRRRKILLAAFMLPLLFALTVSLTPDVTVNHKFIIISLAFANIYIAELLCRLWSGRGRPVGLQADADGTPPRRRTSLIAGRFAAAALTAVLTVTGLQEMIILHNISQNTVGIDSAAPLTVWIEQNTSPDDIFVAAPYHYNAFYLSGRMTWLGHAYYAWSAGHDTAGREAAERFLMGGCGGDPAAVRSMAADEGLDYLIIDDTLRDHPDFSVDEPFFADNFPVAAAFPADGNAVVYDLRAATDISDG